MTRVPHQWPTVTLLPLTPNTLVSLTWTKMTGKFPLYNSLFFFFQVEYCFRLGSLITCQAVITENLSSIRACEKVVSENVYFIYLFLTPNIFKKYFIHLFLERGEGREEERERNIHVWLPLVCSLLGTWPATQACALTGNQTRTLWFAGWHSVHWATPDRANSKHFYMGIFLSFGRREGALFFSIIFFFIFFIVYIITVITTFSPFAHLHPGPIPYSLRPRDYII